MRLILTTLTLLITISLSAQSPVGMWKTVDDETGETKSIVEIYEKGDRLEGAIRKLLLKPQDTVCDACEGDLKGKPVVDMVIIKGMKSSGSGWKSGSILDPESGKTYKCSIWFPEGKEDVLKVRGKHWTGLYRTQEWYRNN